ncbi:hypothetical protein NU219Hw_g3904t2 [Hortaea werneckii]
MEQSKPSAALFDVYLRLRPSASAAGKERFLDVEDTRHAHQLPTHITIKPPADDKRKRAVERFGFTRVFEERCGQRELLESIGILPILEGVLGQPGREGRDGLLATLGVTGSGKETSFMSMPAGPRRNIPRVSNLANHPPVDDIEIAIDRDAEYAVVVSMYEVHNDRIYDLLASSSSSTGNKQQQQQAKRRALLFKSTEKSPDRKVVAGLKKVVCSTLEEALLVLETGLTKRRVAGTGSNAVSSRSHGFFNIEIKKRARSTRGIPVSGPWTSSTLTIVDLAGSERARAAKTAGATLAEAGKINESLMYLGQCMQLQADQAQGLTNANVVPFRQCKLTELLFSNSLGATGGKETGSKKAPQKAVMIVTADPLGDYNATSQILRYSALAREVTVPRVPSVTSQIASAPVMPTNPHGHPTGRATPSNNTAAVQVELEQALATIAALRSELEVSQLLLQEETQRRQEAEASWKVAETRIEEVETEVREEVWEEFESRLALEQRRWRAARDAEMDAQDQHLDRKLEVLTQGMTIYEDETAEKENLEGFDDEVDESDAEREDGVLGKAKGGRPNGSRGANADVARLAEIEAENAVLREKVANAERSKEAQRSPSKKMRVLKTPSKGWRGSGVELWE